jgi:dethiobiotin synthetase
MGRILFVTGTGTDIGKTALSLAIMLWARERGLDAAYLKPVQCGAYPFGNPLPASPHLAAEREGIAIDPAALRRDAEAKAAERGLLILEGAGGAAVPLDRRGATLAGLARDLGAAALMACAPGLGTLHHTLSTAAWLRQAGLPTAGFAFCRRAPGEDPLEDDNRRTLGDLLGLPFFGVLPFAPALARGGPLDAAEAAALWSPLAPALDAWLTNPRTDPSK